MILKDSSFQRFHFHQTDFNEYMMILKDSSFQRFLFRQTDFNELHDDSKRQLIPKISRPSNTFSDKTTSYSDINEETSFSYSNGNTFAQSKEKRL